MNAPSTPLRPIAADHLPLARHLAGKFHIRGMSHADVFQEAVLALCIAERGYKPEKGAWGSYAYRVVFGMLCGVALNNRLIGRFGGPRMAQRVRKTALVLYRAEGRDPTPQELRAALRLIGVDLDDAEAATAVLMCRGGESNLDALRGDHGDTVGDGLASPAPSPEAETLRRETLARIQPHLEALRRSYKPTWRAILEERVLAEEPETLEALGDRFNLSRERMRQLDARVRRDLAHLGERIVAGEVPSALNPAVRRRRREVVAPQEQDGGAGALQA